MDISGTVIKLLELQTGTGKNGPWKKQEFVIEVPGTYPKKVCFSLWGEKITQFPFQEGDDITVYFDLESREHSNRWYTEARAWKVEKKLKEDKVPPPAQEDFPSGGNDAFGDTLPGSDDLPF